MSQRTRARTTGAARRPPEPSPQPSAPGQRTPASPDLSAAALARALRAMAFEVERDPALARRLADAICPDASSPAAAGATPAATVPAEVATTAPESPRRARRAFRPSIITGTSPSLGPGIPDPFALRARLGEAGLHAELDALRLGSLRAIVRAHGLDPTGALLTQNDAARLRACIIDATAARGE